MTTFDVEEQFRAEGAKLKYDVDYNTAGFYLDILENISQAMGRVGMKKSDLAKALKVSPGRVTNLFRGHKTNIELRTIVQVALAIGVDPRDLCVRRKTSEMVSRWKLAPVGFQNASLLKETRNGETEAA